MKKEKKMHQMEFIISLSKIYNSIKLYMQQIFIQ